MQGLAKARALAARGHAQAMLPPHERPDVRRSARSDSRAATREIVARASKEAPQLLAACSSAAAMWAANAATVSPSIDTADGRVHFTPANLDEHFHRSIEAPATTRVLRAIFADARISRCTIRCPPRRSSATRAPRTISASLPSRGRASSSSSTAAPRYDTAAAAPQNFPARQTREASAAIARRHGLDAERTVFAQQNPEAIDAGVFHNDVIAVGYGRRCCLSRARVASAGFRAGELRAGDRRGLHADRRCAAEVSWTTPSGAISSTASCCRARDGGSCSSPRPSAARTPASPRISTRSSRRRTDRGIARVRLAAEHAQRRRSGVPAPRRRADGGRARGDRRARIPRRRARRRARRMDPASTIATGSRRTTSAIRRSLDESRRALDELTAILRLPAVYSFQLVPS